MAAVPSHALGDATTGDELDLSPQSGAEPAGQLDEPDSFSVDPLEEPDDLWETDNAPEPEVTEPEVGTVFEEYDLDLDDFI